MVDVKALFDEARVVSRAAELFQAENDFQRTHEFVEQIRETQTKLLDDILKDLEHKVLAAAAGGYTDATILEFKGGDLYDNLSLLFLLLGGHDLERRQELESHGFVPFIKTLKDAVRPFSLSHDWDRETNMNKLVVRWAAA